MGSLEVNEEELLGGGCRVTRRKRVEKEVGRGGRVWRKKEERGGLALSTKSTACQNHYLGYLIHSVISVLHYIVIWKAGPSVSVKHATSILRVEYSR
jgi:hypothetical protein